MIKKNENVMAADRALAILLCFTRNDRSITLAELSRRVGLDKSTILRLARTLASKDFLSQNPDSSWRLGPALSLLGTVYQETFVLHDVAAPLLQDLSRVTGESAAIYVREGDQRVCLYRHDSERSVRHHIRTGVLLPLDRGAPGRVILAFEYVVEGEPYDEIRRLGHHVSYGERDPEVASAVVPLFQNGQSLFGALAVTGPPHRFTDEAVASHLAALRHVGGLLSRSLGGETTVYGPTGANAALTRAAGH